MPDTIYYSSNMGAGDELQALSDVQAVSDSAIAGLEVAAYIVIDRQIDNSLDPGATPTTGDKYILENSSSLHVNWGTISGIGDNDIVKYSGTAWVIDFNSSSRGKGSTAFVKDEDLEYTYSGTSWVKTSSLYQAENPALENVLDIQTDATLSPSLVEGARYILEDVAALHAGFGTITAPVAVGDNDVVEYIDSSFQVTFDSSVRGEGYGIWVEENTIEGRYYFTGSAWVKKDVLDDHTSLLNIGVKSHATLDTEVGANTTHSSSDGSDHSLVAANTAHITADGSSHSFIDQDVTIAASPALDATNITGLGFAGFDTDVSDTMLFSTGHALDRPDISVTSNGTTSILTIERDGGGDIRIIFPAGVYDWDTSPAVTVNLTSGSDTSPTLNYIYFDDATKTMIANTTGFPALDIMKIATVLCQSAASLQTDGAYKVHGWDDHMYGPACSHLQHLNTWVRSQHATYISGVGQTLTITPNGGGVDNVIFTSASGSILQLHPHAFPAFSGTPDVYTVNDSTTPYNIVTDLSSLLTDSTGASMSGRRFSLVIWGSVNDSTGDCKLYVNLPSGSYNSDSAVIADGSGFANFNVPTDFVGTGFLISELKLRHQTASSGTWTSVQEDDLRGVLPGTHAGGGGGGGTSEFADNAFRIQNVTDATKQIDFDASAITTATTRTITMPDANVDLQYVGDQDVGIAASPSFASPTVSTSLNLTGGQIAFPATQIPSADANTQDDYEEGSFTPTFQDSSFSDAEGQTYSAQAGNYQKIGDWVHFQFYFALTSKGTLTAGDPVNFGGLPFTSENVAGHYGSVTVGYGVNLNITATSTIAGFVDINRTSISARNWDATTGVTAMLVSESGSNGSFMVSGSYRT